MNVSDLVAIDVHTHAEVSCRQPVDVMWEPYEEAASKYFKVGKRPTIAETLTSIASASRPRDVTVDAEPDRQSRIPNAEVIDAAATAATS